MDPKAARKAMIGTGGLGSGASKGKADGGSNMSASKIRSKLSARKPIFMSSQMTIASQQKGRAGAKTNIGAGWGNVFWAANQSSSPTLKLCQDVDQNMVSLLEHLAELGNFRGVVLEDKLLPLK